MEPRRVRITAVVICDPDGPGILDTIQSVIFSEGGSLTIAESFARDLGNTHHEFFMFFPAYLADDDLKRVVSEYCKNLELKLADCMYANFRKNRISARVSVMVSYRFPENRAYACFKWRIMAANQDGKAAEINKILSDNPLNGPVLAITMQSIRTGPDIGSIDIQARWPMLGDSETTWILFSRRKLDDTTRRLKSIKGVTVTSASGKVVRGPSHHPLNGREKDDGTDLSSIEEIVDSFVYRDSSEHSEIDERFGRIDFGP